MSTPAPALPHMTRQGFRALTATQGRLLLREPATLFWLLFPLGMVILFGNIPAFTTDSGSLGGRSVIDVYVPTIAAMVPLFLGCVLLPTNMAQLREKGVLRRLSVSPVPAAGMLAALLAVIAALITAGVTLIIAVGRLAFHVTPPADPGAVVSSFLLGSTAVLALGLVAAALAPTSGAATGTGVPVMVLNFFFSGLYFPVAEMPHALREIGAYVPFGAVTAAWSGEGALWQHLLVLAGYTVVGAMVAVRTFRWE
ncbi:ABC-2 type transport system permease protein [Actinacidiphila yanglinensis]|uniref:ABC-2 type transport system permease protein n=1 Tax=Actinacidiphila yanglinensis TaxID=310779 RepID=A0A1H6CBV6_9ACTN|nr:ABC transporter permease [Actinacidiphila yanglinensis]SEG69876.1 ABC-2 type transport system permease protein [Actinacidiphila yanglinensis]